MSSDEFERRFNNRIDTIVENQARFSEEMLKMQEALAGLVQVARLHDQQIDTVQEALAGLVQMAQLHDQQIDGLIEQGKETREQLSETRAILNALIRIVEGHISNHP